ncbi:hypothetical protein [Streptomyces sp. NPDC051452]|uniref:hypothetical protein n=1 Tax=Streptomyces sp. NPDC051452 TaxID=3365654 RepID=UPI0037B75626
MATHLPLASVAAAQDWLLSCIPDPTAAQHAWDAQQLAAISTGTHWRVAEASLALSLAAMRRLGSHPHGPVLADVHRSLSWWLLPPGLCDELDDVAGLTVHPVGWELMCPPFVHSTSGRWWLALPADGGRLTDPMLLGAAFGPGGYHSEAGDL